MLEQLRLFLTVVEEGSLRRAAERAHISQSAVTRQMQSLEHDLGGRILERTAAGVRPTSGGRALAERSRRLLSDYDSTLAEAQRLVRGEDERLRIGYVASAGQEYLDSPLSALRHRHPKVKVKTLDLTPGEVIAALRRGDVDLALTYLGIDLLSRDFYTRKLSSVPSLVVLPGNHLLASEKQISISQLKHEHFLRVSDECAPGYNRKVSQLCRQLGKFRPRFFVGQQSDTVAETISVSGNENVVSLHPVFISHLRIPNVVMVPIFDKRATWDLFVAWQRGKTAGPLRALLDALNLKPNKSS